MARPIASAASQKSARCAVVKVGRRRALDHLLVAALHRAVALEQVDQVAVLVAKQLDLDMAGAAHQLLEIDLVVAEGRFRLAPRAPSTVRSVRPGRSMVRMPRPPPPQQAFSISG